MHTPSHISHRYASDSSNGLGEKENKLNGISPLAKKNLKSFVNPLSFETCSEQVCPSGRSIRRDTDSQTSILQQIQVTQDHHQCLVSQKTKQGDAFLEKVKSQGKIQDSQNYQSSSSNTNQHMSNNYSQLQFQGLYNPLYNQQDTSSVLDLQDSPKTVLSSAPTNSNNNNFSLKLLNDMLNTPYSHRQESISVKSSQAFPNRSPMQSARVAPTTAANSYYQLNNSSYLSSEIISSKAHYPKENQFKSNSNSDKPNNTPNISDISWKEKYMKNKRNLEQNQVSQALEKKELARLKDSSEKLKNLILNLQSMLKEARDREEQCKILRDNKVKEVQDEFIKKSTQMAQLFDEVSDQYAEFEGNLHSADETYNILKDREKNNMNLIQLKIQDLETKAALKEDLNGKLIQRAELVAQKEDLEAIYCQFQRQYPEEAACLQEEIEIEEASTNNEIQLSEFSEELEQLSQKKTNSQNILQDKQQRLRILTDKLTHLSAVISQEKSIPSRQLAESENRLRDISMQYSLQDLELICCNFVRKIQGNSFSLQDGPGIQQIVLAIRFHHDGISLENVLEYIEKHSLNGQNHACRTQYAFAVEGLLRSLISLEDINDKYCSKEEELVAEYEQTRKDIGAITQDIQGQTEKIIWLGGQITEIKQSQSLESSELKLEELKGKLKELAVKNAQAVFNEYLENSEDQFKKISLEHGEAEVQRLIEEHKHEFERLISNEQSLRLTRMRGVHNEIVKIESKVAANVNIVQVDILPQLKTLLNDLQVTSVRLEQMKADIADYQRAKIRVNQDMELLDKCLQQKIQDINQNLSEEFQDAVLNTEQIEIEIQGKIKQLKQEAVAIERTKQNIQMHAQAESQIRQELRSFEEQCVLQESDNLWIHNASSTPSKQQQQQFDMKRPSIQQQQPRSVTSNKIKNHSKSYLYGCATGQDEDEKAIQVSCDQVQLPLCSRRSEENNNSMSSNRFNQPQCYGYNSSQPYQNYGNKCNSTSQDISYNQQISEILPACSPAQRNHNFPGVGGGSVPQISFPQSLNIRNSNDFSNSQILKSSNILSKSITIHTPVSYSAASPSKTSRSNRSPKNSISYSGAPRQSSSNIAVNQQFYNPQNSSRVSSNTVCASSPLNRQQQLPVKVPVLKQLINGKALTGRQTSHHSGSCGNGNALNSHRGDAQNRVVPFYSPHEKPIVYQHTLNSSQNIVNNCLKNVSVSYGGKPKLSSPETRSNWK